MIKNRVICILLALFALFTLAGCGNMPKEGSGNNVVIDEQGEMVNITLPAAFFGDSSPDEIKAAAKEQGIVKTRVHDDGSVTYRMTSTTRQKILSDMLQKVDNDSQIYFSGDKQVESFHRFERNDDLTQVTFYVDGALFDAESESVVAVYYYNMGAYYQAFAGVPQHEIDTRVSFVDDQTGETLYSLSYQEWIAMQQQ